MIYFYFARAGSKGADVSYLPRERSLCFLIHLNEATGRVNPGAIYKSPLNKTTGFVSFVLNLL